jgi:hypothetical protein
MRDRWDETVEVLIVFRVVVVEGRVGGLFSVLVVVAKASPGTPGAAKRPVSGTATTKRPTSSSATKPTTGMLVVVREVPVVGFVAEDEVGRLVVAVPDTGRFAASYPDRVQRSLWRRRVG